MKKKILSAICVLATMAGSSQVLINEYSCANKALADNFGNTSDWVELYNAGATTANIAGYYMSDNATNTTKWQVPAGTTIPAGGFLRFWCSGMDSVVGTNYHTNFKLTQCKPDMFVLANGSGGILDSVHLRRHQKDHSWGRQPNGSTTWKVYTAPTPTLTNGATGLDNYAAKPVMNVAPGFYASAQTISLSTTEIGASIRYTINGFEPTVGSTLYIGPFAVSATTVIRAKVFSPNPQIFESFIETNTYFINQSAYTFPVISLCGDQLMTLLNGNSGTVPTPNLEYFDESKAFVYETYGEADKHGNDSWAFNQRGIDFKADDEYGYNYTNPVQFFDDAKLGVSTRDRFDNIILKAGASDNYPGDSDPSCHMRDAFVQSYAFRKNLDLDGRRYQPVIVFANGAYWGIYELREKFDTDYTEYYYNQPENQIDNLKFWGGLNIQDGSDTGWVNIYNYVMGNNMGVPANYSYVDSKLSISSMIDYMVYNSYVMNSDFINWNSAWWRGRNPNGNKKKWRYWMWDMDNVYNLGENFSGLPSTSWDVDPCDYSTVFNGTDPNMGHPQMLQKLIDENDTVKSQYINRYADLINTALQCDSILEHHTYFRNFLQPERTAHVAKWGGTMAQWDTRILFMDSMIRMRCTYIDSAIQGCYNVTPFPLNVDVQPPGSGMVKVNTIIPSNYPWVGSYYAPVYMDFAGIPGPNYKFDHWTFANNPVPAGDPSQDTLTLYTFDTTEYVVAYFKLKEPYELTGEVIVPTAFTPNADGLNDLLYPYGTLYVSKLEFEVFNRWGQKVFATNDKMQGWDGKFQGTEAPMGVYAYRLKALVEGKSVERAGNITLIR
ncbi:MAG: CotH kinase family protein [Bacteroidia bacterium]|nr:CotH kinase family protein [Bacteroidia bacterium]